MNKYERMNEEYESRRQQKKRLAAYCRVSTDSEEQMSSLENQRAYFKDWVANHPEYELVEIYADEGISGTSTKNRAEFNRMIQAAMNGEIDMIATKEVSRFARNTLDVLNITRKLKSIGVGVEFTSNNINTLTEKGEMFLTMISSVAQEESRNTSQRVEIGQTMSMKQGNVFGGSLLGYDVVDGKISINEEGAEIVREIFDKYVNQEKGTNTIAKELYEEGKRPRSGGNWNIQHIIRILRNEKYAGDLVQRKTFTPDYLTHKKKMNKGEKRFIQIMDHHKPIVSRELFDAAQARLDSRTRESSKVGHSNRYWLSGKIACGRCGTNYVAR